MRRRVLVSVDVAPARALEIVEQELGLISTGNDEFDGSLHGSADASRPSEV